MGELRLVDLRSFFERNIGIKIKKLSWNFIFLFLLCSCQNVKKSSQYAEFEIPAVYSLNQDMPEFLLINCFIESLVDRKRYLVGAPNCTIAPYDDIVRFAFGKVDKSNQKNDITWVKGNFVIRQFAVLSRTSDEILMIGRTFWKDSKKKCYSTDRLMIFNWQGSIKKSFDLKSFAAESIYGKKQLKLIEDKKLSCMADKSKPISRLTILSSFRVRYDESGLLMGYYVQDIPSRKLILFDPNLVPSKIYSIDGNNLKAATQIGKNKFLFFDLSEVGVAEPLGFAKLTEYDLESRSFRTLFNSTIPIFFKKSCAMISVLNPHQIMVVHSECTKVPAPETSQLEFIDFAKNQSQLIELARKKLPEIIEPFSLPEGFWKQPDSFQ